MKKFQDGRHWEQNAPKVENINFLALLLLK